MGRDRIPQRYRDRLDQEIEPQVYEKDARRAEFQKRSVCRRCGAVGKLYRGGVCAGCLSEE